MTSQSWSQESLEGRVRKELQQLDELLASAKDVLAAFENREARDWFNKALVLRQDAETKFNRAKTLNDHRFREGLFKEALANIALAKANAEQAIKLALQAPLLRLRNNLDELMRRAEQTVLGGGNREAERLLYEAKKNHAEAERAVVVQNLRRAAELYQIAISLVEKAISLVEGRRSTPEATPEAAISREKERYDNLETRAREAVETNKNSPAFLVFEQAQKQARAAREAFHKGQGALAQQLYRGATRLLLRAIDLAMAGQQVEEWGRNEAALLKDLIQSAEQEIRENPDPRASLLLERARILVREAEVALDRRQMPEARWRIELARSFIDKAMRKTDWSSVNRNNLEQRYHEALQDLARDIEEVGSKAREANKTEALQLVELATNARKAAENAGRQAQQTGTSRSWFLAFRLIRAAQYFLLRAEMMLQDLSAPGTANTPARETLTQRMAQLENAVLELRQSTGSDNPESCQAVATQAMVLLKRARAAVDRKELRLASAILEVVNDLMDECSKGK
ncbi:MAG: hypothetical protein ONB44_18130 [candidate division KSB1 bacterium]|nr:hypothetical protein [candidate division KSB1 bacterium]MDZ7304047.1 hypothetical protein [candidate division KSB1 bacterium]